MTFWRWYIGVDPGPSTGLVALGTDGKDWAVHAFQCDGDSAVMLVNWACCKFQPRVVGVEAFVPSNKGGDRGKDAELTRAVQHQAKLAGTMFEGTTVVTKRATDVKPWADNEKRFKKVGFPLGPKFKDARSALWQALHAACKEGRERDPLA